MAASDLTVLKGCKLEVDSYSGLWDNDHSTPAHLSFVSFPESNYYLSLVDCHVLIFCCIFNLGSATEMESLLTARGVTDVYVVTIVRAFPRILHGILGRWASLWITARAPLPSMLH